MQRPGTPEKQAVDDAYLRLAAPLIFDCQMQRRATFDVRNTEHALGDKLAHFLDVVSPGLLDLQGASQGGVQAGAIPAVLLTHTLAHQGRLKQEVRLGRLVLTGSVDKHLVSLGEGNIKRRALRHVHGSHQVRQPAHDPRHEPPQRDWRRGTALVVCQVVQKVASVQSHPVPGGHSLVHKGRHALLLVGVAAKYPLRERFRISNVFFKLFLNGITTGNEIGVIGEQKRFVVVEEGIIAAVRWHDGRRFKDSVLHGDRLLRQVRAEGNMR